MHVYIYRVILNTLCIDEMQNNVIVYIFNWALGCTYWGILYTSKLCKWVTVSQPTQNKKKSFNSSFFNEAYHNFTQIAIECVCMLNHTQIIINNPTIHNPIKCLNGVILLCKGQILQKAWCKIQSAHVVLLDFSMCVQLIASVSLISVYMFCKY